MEYGKSFNPYGMFRGIFLPNCIACADISDRAKLLLGRLYQYAGENGKAYPAIDKLASDLFWSRSKVNRAIKDLKEYGLIKTFQEDEQSPSYYIFIYSPLYENKERCAVRSDTGGSVAGDTGGSVTYDTHKEEERKRESFSKKTEKQSESKDSQRSKLKRRTSQTNLAEDKPRPSLNRKSKLSILREGDKSKPEPDFPPSLYIPERTLSFLAYWNKQASLPRIIVNPENPSKILKRVVKYVGQFFSGKLFHFRLSMRNRACVMPKNLNDDDWTELLQMRSEEDLKNFVDILVAAIASEEYFIPKCLSVETFLVGSRDTKTAHGETFLTPSILVSHSFLEPDKLHKLPEHNPLLTEKLIKLWDKMIRNNSEKFAHEEFIKASNSIHNIYHDLELDDRIELSMSGIYFGEVALAQRVRMMNSWRFEKSDISPKVFNSNWFKEKAVEVKGEFMGVR